MLSKLFFYAEQNAVGDFAGTIKANLFLKSIFTLTVLSAPANLQATLPANFIACSAIFIGNFSTMWLLLLNHTVQV